MFKNIFSFNGRIRRTEYGISFIIYGICCLIVTYFSEVNGSEGIFLLMIPAAWFILAQGAKRCHDLGKSGWWQLIPFYVFWMLFADGVFGTNQFGLNPKGIVGYDPINYVDPPVDPSVASFVAGAAIVSLVDDIDNMMSPAANDPGNWDDPNNNITDDSEDADNNSNDDWESDDNFDSGDN